MAANNIKKNQSAKAGGSFSYKYADIAQIHEYLEAHGLAYYQYTERVFDDDYIVTVPIVNGRELPPLRGCKVIEATLSGRSNPAQQQGSALTYARRYSLLMAFGLATEDDDAQALNDTERKATPAMVAFIKEKYTGENMVRLMKACKISKIEDISFQKADELIKAIKGSKNE